MSRPPSWFDVCIVALLFVAMSLAATVDFKERTPLPDKEGIALRLRIQEKERGTTWNCQGCHK